MKRYNLKFNTVFTVTLAVATLAALSALLMALLHPTVAPAPAGVETLPSPLELDEFNRQHCQLELDTDNTINTYCKGE